MGKWGSGGEVLLKFFSRITFIRPNEKTFFALELQPF